MTATLGLVLDKTTLVPSRAYLACVRGCSVELFIQPPAKAGDLAYLVIQRAGSSPAEYKYKRPFQATQSPEQIRSELTRFLTELRFNLPKHLNLTDPNQLKARPPADDSKKAFDILSRCFKETETVTLAELRSPNKDLFLSLEASGLDDCTKVSATDSFGRLVLDEEKRNIGVDLAEFPEFHVVIPNSKNPEELIESSWGLQLKEFVQNLQEAGFNLWYRPVKNLTGLICGTFFPGSNLLVQALEVLGIQREEY